MNFTHTYLLPIVLATILHVIVVMGMMMNWESQSTIDVTPVEKYYIEASVVRENPHEVKKRRKEEDKARELARQRQIEAQKEKEHQARLNAQREKQEQQEKQAPEPKALDLVDIPDMDDESENEDAGDPVTEEARKEMEQSLVMEVLEEQEYRRAVTDDEKAMAYVARIQQDIIQNWSRPPSARNGMEALLRVRLVPTGEVVDVSVEKSSGNEAFDRSAVLAVEKVDRFQVPQNSRQFERNFREFTVLFRPEDLRL